MSRACRGAPELERHGAGLRRGGAIRHVPGHGPSAGARPPGQLRGADRRRALFVL
jgi:hypothetical protein